MIENIRQFVDEHHTLMIVIIWFVALCFIYWLLFCKCSSTGNKVKGGTAQRGVCYLGNRDPFEVLGLAIDDDFFVLNEAGRKEVEKTNDYFKTYVLYVNHYTRCNFVGDYLSLPNLVKNPYHFFNLNTNSGSAVINLIPNERKSSKRQEPRGRCDRIEAWERFNFEKSLEIAVEDEGIKEDIKGSFKRLRDFVRDYFHVYFDRVNYIGQPAICKAGDEEVFTGHEIVPLTKISPNRKGNLNGELYFCINDFLRSWYPQKGEDARKMFRTAAWIGKVEGNESGRGSGDGNINGNSGNFKMGIRTKVGVEGEEKYVEPFVIPNDLYDLGVGVQSGGIRGVSNGKSTEKKWEIADIFPAYKLLEMIYFLFGLMEYYIEMRIKKKGRVDRVVFEREYFKMLASYIIFVNLFNGYCGIQMESKWNEKVGNLYVYNFAGQWDNIKSGAVMRPFAAELVEKNIMRTVGKEISAMNVADEDSMTEFLKALGKETKEKLFTANCSGLITRLREKEDVVVGFEETEWDTGIGNMKEELEEIIGELLIYKASFTTYLLELKEKGRDTTSSVGGKYEKFRKYCKDTWGRLVKGLELTDSAPESQDSPTPVLQLRLSEGEANQENHENFVKKREEERERKRAVRERKTHEFSIQRRNPGLLNVTGKKKERTYDLSRDAGLEEKINQILSCCGGINRVTAIVQLTKGYVKNPNIKNEMDNASSPADYENILRLCGLK